MLVIRDPQTNIYFYRKNRKNENKVEIFGFATIAEAQEAINLFLNYSVNQTKDPFMVTDIIIRCQSLMIEEAPQNLLSDIVSFRELIKNK